MKKTGIAIVLILIWKTSFSQEIEIAKYESTYFIAGSEMHYTLLLSAKNEFLLYGGGNYQWDMSYPQRAFYGTYRESADTLHLEFIPLDSITDTITDYQIKLKFNQYSIWVETQRNYPDQPTYCVRKQNTINFQYSNGIPLPQKNKIFSRTEEPLTFSFSIKGLLPTEFTPYVNTLEFSFNHTSTDIYLAHFPEYFTSIKVSKLINSTVDSFSISLNNYQQKSFIYTYSDNHFNQFMPSKFLVDSLNSSSINNIFLQYADNHKADWKYLNKHLPVPRSIPSKIESECLTVGDDGNTIDLKKEVTRLRKNIIKRCSDNTSIEAFKRLLKSDYFKEMRFITRLTKDSLPSEPLIVYKMLETFRIEDLTEIYHSFYEIPDSLIEKIIEFPISDPSRIQYFISKAGFSKDKTVAFIRVKTQERAVTKDKILVFERRMNQYIVTGVIEDGKHQNKLTGDKCDYFQDMRNYRLFY